jgi:hypothetical protein
MAFNGHRNWTQWNVSLWLNNDEGLYRMMVNAYGHGRRAKVHAASLMLDRLNELGLTKTPDGARYSVTAIRAAMVGL